MNIMKMRQSLLAPPTCIKYSFLFFVFIFFSAHSQIFKDSLGTKVYHNNQVYHFDSNNIFLSFSNLKFQDTTLALPESFEQRFVFREVNGVPYAICQENLDLYVVEDSTLTLYAKNSNRSFIGRPALFKRRDSLFMLAKSKSNSYRNSLFYYDHNEKLWQSLKGDKMDEHVADLINFQTIDFNDKLFLFGGLKPDERMPFKVNQNRTLCVYDFEDHSWRHLGIHNMNNLGVKATSLGETSIFIDNTVNNVSLLNFDQNSVYFKPMSTVFGNIKPLKLTVLDPKTLLVFSLFPTPRLDRINLEDTFYAEKVNFPIYVDEGYILPWALVLLALILGSVAIVIIRKRAKEVQQLSYNGEKLWFGQKFVSLSVEHQKMIQFMLRGETLETADIVGLFTGREYSVSHMHKLKNDLVNNLKQIFLNLTDRNDVLIIEKSKEDSRMSVYRLDLKQFDTATIKAHSKNRNENAGNNREEE